MHLRVIAFRRPCLLASCRFKVVFLMQKMKERWREKERQTGRERQRRRWSCNRNRLRGTRRRMFYSRAGIFFSCFNDLALHPVACVKPGEEAGGRGVAAISQVDNVTSLWAACCCCCCSLLAFIPCQQLRVALCAARAVHKIASKVSLSLSFLL